MRLICGFVRLDGTPADRSMLSAMIVAMTAPGLHPHVAHRIEGGAALAVLDFSSTPASHELPVDGNGTWLAADLRLDRPVELAATLATPADVSAENLALAACNRWGQDLPDRVDGDFALAAWNPARAELLCCRDIIGARPICYTHRPREFFAFASLPKGLHDSGLVPRRLDMVALGRLLVEVFNFGALTGFEDVAWLPAGHSLLLSRDQLRIHWAWRPSPSQVGTWRGTPREAAETLRALVQDAVACRLPPAGAVATHLSGGLDSTAVAIVAARRLRQTGRKLYAFSQLARDISGLRLPDERPFVEAALVQEPDIVCSPVHLLNFTGPGLDDVDLPLSGPSISPEDRICMAAAAHGAPIVLSGIGGDPLASYNGLGLHAALFRQGHWLTLFNELRLWAKLSKRPFFRTAKERVFLPLVPDFIFALRRRLRGLAPPFDLRSSLEFLAAPLQAQVAAAIPIEPKFRNRPEDRIRLLTEGEHQGRAAHWATIGARHGVAFTYPLFDRRIIDFILSLPLTRLVDGGFARQPFRNAMEGILPEAIRLRQSKFASTPDILIQLATEQRQLLHEVDELRSSRPVAAAFDLDAIATALAAAPGGQQAEQAASVLNVTGVHPTLRRARKALLALFLARYVARFS